MSGKLGVINIGLQNFYEALISQDVNAIQLDWRPPAKYSSGRSLPEKLRAKVLEATRKSAESIIKSKPFWVDILPAIECVDGLTDHMIIHSGPPIEYNDMCELHRRGMISGVLMEGWADNEQDAEQLILSGKIKIESALDHNTVGAGTGIITKSIAMIVIEDRNTGIRAATFPAEGVQFQGGFCGWGLYSPEIAENLRYMREEIFPVMREYIRQKGGLALKPILAESFQMGDENHTRQTAADLLFIKQVIPELMKMDADKQDLLRALQYITETPRFFHCFGQGASRSALLGASNIPYSGMVTAVCGNALEFGIKVSGLGDRWFTAPAPMLEGKFTSGKFKEEDRLPWIGDSCVVECAGMGGIAAAASPIVCRLRGMNCRDAVALTREMEQICVAKNNNFPIPNLDFDFLPVGIDIFRVLETGITPEIHGGMFNRAGGLIGAGSARVPIECFEKAYDAFIEEYAHE